MNPDSLQFAPFAARMYAEGLPKLFIDTFAEQFSKIRPGDSVMVGFDATHTICFQGN